MADEYPGWSPYNYAMCNPIIIIDFDERDTIYYAMLPPIPFPQEVKYPVRSFSDFTAEKVHDDPWYYSGQFYGRAFTMTSYEMKAIMEGRDYYTDEDIEEAHGDFIDFATLFFPIGKLGKLGFVFKGFTKHGLSQIINRGFKPSFIKEILNKGTAVIKTGRYGTPNIHVTLGKNTIVIETAGRNAGKIISVFSNSKTGNYIR